MAFLTRNELEDMDFNSLVEYVKTQFNKLKLAQEGFTCYKDELIDLCDVLNKKIVNDYEKALGGYDKPPDSYPPFMPSARLFALWEKRTKLLRDSKDKHKTYGARRKIQAELSNALAEIKILHPQEREEHRKQMATDRHRNELAIKNYYENRKKAELAERQKREDKILEVEKIRKRIIEFFRSREPEGVHKINWQILPPGEWSMDRIAKHFKELEKVNPKCEYDLERLEHIKTLKPSTCYIGFEEFIGYVVFCFDYTEKAILENPIKGNAIYLINNNWPELSKLTKRELLSYHSDRVTRIIHRGNWFERLKAKIAK